MSVPEVIPIPPPDEGQDRSERSKAGVHVGMLMHTDGWRTLMDAVDSQLRAEQRIQMKRGAGKSGEAYFERQIGEWIGMRKVRAIAEGIVRDGKTAEAELRNEE